MWETSRRWLVGGAAVVGVVFLLGLAWGRLAAPKAEPPDAGLRGGTVRGGPAAPEQQPTVPATPYPLPGPVVHDSGQTAAPAPSQGANTVPQAPDPYASKPGPAPQGQMPSDVEAYLRWLARVDLSRVQLDKEAEDVMGQTLPLLMTGGMGVDPDPSPSSPLSRRAPEFSRWAGRVSSLEQSFRSLQGLDAHWQRLGVLGSVHVPSQCSVLHSFYGRALGVEAGMARELAAAMASNQMDRVTKQMQSSRTAQDVLERADTEFGAVCSLYKVPQFYHIQVVPGTTQPQSVLPH